MSNLTDDQLLDELRSRFHQQKESLDQVERLANELKVLNQKLEESEKLKTHFLSNIRNEIINPFASIIGLSQNIQMLGPDKIQRIRNLAAMIHSEAFTLDFQLQNIFAAAEIEAGEITPQFMKVDIISIINSVLEAYKHEITKKNLQVVLTTTPNEIFFVTDAEKLGLIFSNLLSNSIKYSHSEGEIHITIQEQNGMLDFIISDKGIGIDPAYAKMIFDRFKRIDNTINTLNSGYGLGLSIVGSMLEMLNGSIRVESEHEKGATFYVTIQEAQISNGAEGFALDGNEFLFGDEGDVF